MTPNEIKALRSRLGLTARGLAKALSLEPGTVTSWERGDTFPTKKAVDRLQALLDSSTTTRKTAKPRAPTSPLAALSDPKLWMLIRKLIVYEDLRTAVLALADTFRDPTETLDE